MKAIELEVTFTPSGTVVVTVQTAQPNVLDMAYGTIVAAGSPRSVSDELKRVFGLVIAREKVEPSRPRAVAELTDQGD